MQLPWDSMIRLILLDLLIYALYVSDFFFFFVLTMKCGSANKILPSFSREKIISDSLAFNITVN